MSHAYRSDYQQIIARRLMAIRLGRECLTEVLPELSEIRRARIARSVAGLVGIVGMAFTVFFACLDSGELPTISLIGSSLAAFVAWAATRIGLRYASKLTLSQELPELTGELTTDLARLDERDPVTTVLAKLGELERWSTTLPLVATSLLAPLSLHWLVAVLLEGGSLTLESFAGWIRLSLVIVGHAHLALAALAVAFSNRMHQMPLEVLALQPKHAEWAKAWGLTIAVAAMPGILLLCFPPILTAITGIVFIPAMFLLARQCVMNERAAMDRARESTRLRVASEVGMPTAAPLEELIQLEESSPLAHAARS